MDERNERDRKQPAEGVRIIGAEEAQAALEAGAAAGRRPDDELRFGDVPPAPSGPRPPHRFPLPDSVDPAAAVPRSPVASAIRADDRARRGRGAPVVPADQAPGEAPAAPAPDETVVEAAAPAPDETVVEAAIPEVGPPAGDPRYEDATGPGLTPAQPRPDWHTQEEPALRLVHNPQPAPPDAGGPSAPRQPEAAPWETSEAGEAEQDYRSVGYEPSPSFGSSGGLGLYRDDAYGDQGAGPVPPGEPPPPDLLSLPPLDLPTPQASPEGEPPERISLGAHDGPELPHWTDPPTGEVPRILGGDVPVDDDDLDAWQALGARGLRWRDEAGDWDDVEEMQDLGSEEARVGALDTTRAEHSDLYSFDEDFERLEEERSGQHVAVSVQPPEEEPVFESPQPAARAAPRPAPPRRGPSRPPGEGSGGSRDLGMAVAVGVGFIVVLLIFYAIGSAALVVLAAAVVGAASGRRLRDAAARRVPSGDPGGPGGLGRDRVRRLLERFSGPPVGDRPDVRRHHGLVPVGHRRRPAPGQRGRHRHDLRLGGRSGQFCCPAPPGARRQRGCSWARSSSPWPPTSPPTSPGARSVRARWRPT